jgi:hypothetical protein
MVVDDFVDVEGTIDVTRVVETATVDDVVGATVLVGIMDVLDTIVVGVEGVVGTVEVVTAAVVEELVEIVSATHT